MKKAARNGAAFGGGSSKSGHIAATVLSEGRSQIGGHFVGQNPDRIGGFILLFVLFALGAIIYFIPSFVARNRNHAQKSAIFWLNFFTGWSFIGWVAALIWALTNPTVVSTEPTGTREKYISDTPRSRISQNEKICPRCAESVKAAALVCRYCGHEFAAEAPKSKSILETNVYRGVPYTQYDDYSVTAIVNSEIRAWGNALEFRAAIDAMIERGQIDRS
ncbi:superinfection immunity protein [Xanthobacter aminoxidans]|uniref:Superinfection immunity protein n=1 Tax=Xanthobacter aminoxidans TaxID=186280 RepID=A0ABW6ZA11_9HYPH